MLLFDAVFVEDRPIVELIAPTFGYQSDFLRTWYTTNLKPPPVDEKGYPLPTARECWTGWAPWGRSWYHAIDPVAGAKRWKG